MAANNPALGGLPAPEPPVPHSDECFDEFFGFCSELAAHVGHTNATDFAQQWRQAKVLTTQPVPGQSSHARPDRYLSILDDALEVYKKTLQPVPASLMIPASNRVPFVWDSRVGHGGIEEGKALAQLFRLCTETRAPGHLVTKQPIVAKHWRRLGWAVMESSTHAAAMVQYQKHFSAIKNGTNSPATFAQHAVIGNETRTQFGELRREVKGWALSKGVIRRS